MAPRLIALWPAAALAIVVTPGCARQGPGPGTVQDEAARASVEPAHFRRPTPDYFREMDYNVVHGTHAAFGQPEIQGRNMWLVWTGGNDRLWDRLTVDSLGSFDLLKTISSHPRLGTAVTIVGTTSAW